MLKRIQRKQWRTIGIVEQALEIPDLLDLTQEFLLNIGMEKAAYMFDRWLIPCEITTLWGKST